MGRMPAPRDHAHALTLRVRGWARRVRDRAGPALRRLAPAWRRVRSAAGPVLRDRRTRFAGRLLMMIAVTIAGMAGGLLLGGHSAADVGPFRAQFSLTPSLSGGTQVQVPPLGSLSLHSHAGPLHLIINLGSLDRQRTEALIHDPNGIAMASQHAIADLKTALVGLGVRAGIAMLVGALLLNTLVYRRGRRVLLAGGLSLLLMGGAAGWTAATFRPNSIQEPRYEGLLTMAPSVVGDARTIVNSYGQYSKELQRLVDNVSKLYGTVSKLPVYEPSPGTTRVLHVSDLHLNPAAWDVIQTVVKQYHIDLVVDTGDIVDWGSGQEDAFVGNIRKVGVPYVYIRGNHDSLATAQAVRKEGGIVLENQVRTVKGITFAGIGDPRFTPDKETEPAKPGAAEPKDKVVSDSARELSAAIVNYDAAHATAPVDVAMMHDPLGADQVNKRVPLVLAGHLHLREVKQLSPQTMLMVQGSTGGAGLRGLQQKTPVPLDLSVLYFDAKHRLSAYDDISVGGTGRSEVALQRHIVGGPAGVSPSGSASASPSPS